MEHEHKLQLSLMNVFHFAGILVINQNIVQKKHVNADLIQINWWKSASQIAKVIIWKSELNLMAIRPVVHDLFI